MSRFCLACEFIAKNNDSLQRHVDKCLVAREKKRRRILKLESETIEHILDALHKTHNELEQIMMKSDTSNTMNNVIYDEVLSFFELNQNLQIDLKISSTKNEVDSSLKLWMKNFVNDEQTSIVQHESNSSTNNKVLRSLQSITFFLIAKEYHEEKRIEELKQNVVKEEDFLHQIEQISSDSHTKYFSFLNVKDSTFAKWLVKYNHSKDFVNDLLRNSKLEEMNKDWSFRNANEWLAQLHRISHEIQNDHFETKTFFVENTVNDLERIEYNMYYRDVVEIVRFMLEHELFQNNLTYASIQLKTANDIRVYTEMHTENWWWRTQNQLSEKTTIVSILLTIDKTQMTQHHEDLNLWSVYMIIDNLDRTTRRSQFRFSLVLVDLILIVKIEKKHKKYLQAKIYHWAMKIIFKRVFLYYLLCSFQTNKIQRSRVLR